MQSHETTDLASRIQHTSHVAKRTQLKGILMKNKQSNTCVSAKSPETKKNLHTSPIRQIYAGENGLTNTHKTKLYSTYYGPKRKLTKSAVTMKSLAQTNSSDFTTINQQLPLPEIIQSQEIQDYDYSGRKTAPGGMRPKIKKSLMPQNNFMSASQGKTDIFSKAAAHNKRQEQKHRIQNIVDEIIVSEND